MSVPLATVRLAKSRPRYHVGGAALRAARESVGFSQDQIAEAWGVSRPFVGDVEEGTHPLTHERIVMLPPAVAKAYLAPMLTRAEAECAKVENDLLLLAEVAEDPTAGAMARALSDGAWTRSEAGEVRAHAQKQIDQLREVVKRCDDVDAAGGVDGVRRG